MYIRIRKADTNTDLEGIAAIVNQFDQTPSSPEDVRRLLTYLPSGRITCRLVAVDDSGCITGYACAVHEPWNPPGAFYVWVGVDAPSRHQEVGRTLHEKLWSFLDSQQAGSLYSEVNDDDPPSLRFAESHGFTIERHLFQSSLDLNAFAEDLFTGLVEKLATEGIRFFTLADLGDSVEARHRIYELDAVTSEDIPGYIGPFMDYAEYERRAFNPAVYNPAVRLIAAVGESWVGFASVTLVSETGNAHNEMTGVLREYRGRGIALALKLLAIRYAREAGARKITTSNDSLNAPMLAVNRKLGYQQQRGVYRLKNEHPVFPV